jgi:hypothetical protein
MLDSVDKATRMVFTFWKPGTDGSMPSLHEAALKARPEPGPLVLSDAVAKCWINNYIQKQNT